MAPTQPSSQNHILAILRHERLRRIVAWLLENEEAIASLERVQITFDCAGKKIKAWKTPPKEDI